MKVAANVLDRQFLMHQEEYEAKALAILRKGWYILGSEVAAFEQEFAAYLGVKHFVGLASGLDALQISMRLLGIGRDDEVIVQSNAYIACVMGITINGAVPVFVEPNEFHMLDETKIEEKITAKTKAILVVHLYGQVANMTAICSIARKYDIKVIEDCAQSHGACWDDRMSGTFGDAGCFSFYPSKNLGAFGDAGGICTNNGALAEQCLVYRNYGSEKRYYNRVVGTNSRMDELQAGLLRVKLKYLDELNAERSAICGRYLHEISNPLVELPRVCAKSNPVWHQFVVCCNRRDELARFLEEKNIGTLIHYPIPPHLSEAYKHLGIQKGTLPTAESLADRVLSLPLYNGLEQKELDYVIDAVNAFRVT